MNISSSNGKAIVTFHAEIGPILVPPRVPQTPIKQRSPSYQRSIARRHAMRENEIICTEEAVEASTVEVANENLNKTVKSVIVDDGATTSTIACAEQV